MQHFHSTRFGISVPLPDGPHWRIDDHKTPMMRATHEPTQSVVELAIWREDELMNRAKCEEHARQKSFAKELAAEVIDSEVISLPPGWDTGVSIGVEQSENGDKTATAHLVVFAAYLRKCMTFHFSTRAKTSEATVLSDRLAFVRLRVFGELKLDSFDIQREAERPPKRP
jgi:hypothetical protein